MTALTYSQLTQNIDAMQTQGASHDDIQGYLNSMKKGADGTYAPASAAAPTPAPAQAPVTTDTSNGAFFPSAPTDNGLVAGLKTAGNLLPSAFNFAKGALNSVNPLAIAKTASDIGTSFGEGMNEGSDPFQLLKDTITGLPAAAYKTLVPKFGQDLIAGDVGKAGADVTNDPVGSIAPFVFGAKALASGVDAFNSRGAAAPSTALSDAMDTTMKKVAAPVTKPIAAAASAAGNLIPSTGAYIFGKATGIEPKTISTVANDPAAFSKENMAQISRPALGQTINSALQGRITDLGETGKNYEPVRASTAPIKVDPAFLKNAIQDSAGVTFAENAPKVPKGPASAFPTIQIGDEPAPTTGETISANGASSVRDPGEIAKLQKLYNFWKPSFDSGQMSTTEFLNFRSDLAKMAKYEGGIGKSAPLDATGKALRSNLNSTYRGQVPGLEDLDLQYTEQTTQLKNLKKGLLDKDGNLRDNAPNVIANSLGKGKEALAARLEQISPGITKQVMRLKAAEDFEAAAGNKVGTYTRSTLGAGGMLAGITTGNLPMIAASIGEMVLSNPDVSRNVIRAYGYSKPLMQAVAGYLRKGASAVNQLPASVPSATVFGRPPAQISQ